jgi:homoserine dehydrogenase
MTEKGEAFEDVLRRAQELGLAEADPTFDIEGIDATHKLVLLTYLAYGQHAEMKQVLTQGISDLQPIDINFAKEFGYKVKLLAIARQSDGMVEARVHPR